MIGFLRPNDQPRPHPVRGEFDPRLGRVRTNSDDFYDHRKYVLARINASLAAEKMRRQGRG